MRRILGLAMLLPLFLGAFIAKGQGVNGEEMIYKPFKVDVGINLTFPATPDLTIGGGFFVEPRYSINDRFQMGLHLGSNIIGEGRFFFHNTEATTKAQAIGNLALTGEYQFTVENVRPFLGLTAGMYRRSDYEIIDKTNGRVITNRGTNVNFGFGPRIGVVAGKFRINGTYNFSGKGITDFVSVGLGIQFGGGKIN